MIDIRQSERYVNYMKSLGWKVERLAEINYFIKKFPIVGAVIKIQRPEEIRFDTIFKLSRKYGVFQIILEPNNSWGLASPVKNHELMRQYGFKLSDNPYLATKTLQIDLTESRETILSHFKKDARQAVKRGGAFTAKVYSSPNEIKIFREAWKDAVKHKRYVPQTDQLLNLRKSFPQNHSLFLASHNISGRIIGGVIFTTSSHDRSNYITYYWQAFTNSEGRTSLSQYSLLYQGILWAKKQGYKIFDFEGIYDSRFPNKSWLGFTHFKHSFGGYEVTYPGCYTKTDFFRRW